MALSARRLGAAALRRVGLSPEDVLNVPHRGVGHVTRFEVRTSFLDRYPVRPAAEDPYRGPVARVAYDP
ncbi:hypothetical protein NE236_27915 [Actinoallomurus purpureus]|uniref:hypothetical protein n=1 Tax=Actinoallomurus purpureus TaxID=478114 RepID=UPI002093DA0F|nr:hypothetical protein [Actinoallomurus purpureus]MCO6008808.1 hypothetical protein [Actinoallomurus purpureus]